MKVLLLTKYGRLGASSRLRTLQYIPELAKAGIEVDVSPLFGNAYIQRLYGVQHRSPTMMIRDYLARTYEVLRSKRYEAIWLEKELLPWLPFNVENAILPRGMPFVLDIDDAIFHRYDQHRWASVRRRLGHKIAALMARAAVVVAGNTYLADYATRARATRVEVIPTVVDVGRYSMKSVGRSTNTPLRIGWIGSPSTQHYLFQISSVLAEVTRSREVVFRVIGASEDFDLNGVAMEKKAWEESTEATAISECDIGVMPLPDEPWERGKCGYKLIQFMASAVPVVASPVGANVDIVHGSMSGFLADSEESWLRSLTALISSSPLRRAFGESGRSQVEREYSVQCQASRLTDILMSLQQ